MNSNDIELLRRYVFERSEAAFADLVRQHIALVYSAVLRQTNGDAPLAQDVTQVVFTDLARKAARLTRPLPSRGGSTRAHATPRQVSVVLNNAEAPANRKPMPGHRIDALEFMVLAGQDQLWVPEMHCLCVDVLRHLAAGTGS
jgi:hypothetical protein